MDENDKSDIWRAISALEAHKCETHKHIVELKDEIHDLRDTKADLAGVKEATRLAKEVMDARLATMNAFREALSDQSSSFITRSEYTVHHSNIENCLKRNDEDIRVLRESRAELQGKASQSQVNVALFIAAVGIVLAVMGLLLQGL